MSRKLERLLNHLKNTWQLSFVEWQNQSRNIPRVFSLKHQLQETGLDLRNLSWSTWNEKRLCEFIRIKNKSKKNVDFFNGFLIPMRKNKRGRKHRSWRDWKFHKLVKMIKCCFFFKDKSCWRLKSEEGWVPKVGLQMSHIPHVKKRYFSSQNKKYGIRMRWINQRKREKGHETRSRFN